MPKSDKFKLRSTFFLKIQLHALKFDVTCVHLTDGIFETSAYRVPSKSQNPTVLGQGGPSSEVHFFEKAAKN